MSPSLEDDKKRGESQEYQAQAEEIKRERQALEKEIQDSASDPAKSEALKKQLREQVVSGMKGMAQKAIEVFAATTKKNQPPKSEDEQKKDKEDAKTASKSIVKFLTAVAKDLFSTDEIPEKERNILKNLATTLQDSPDAFFLQPVIERMLQEPGFFQIAEENSQQKTTFEQEYEKIKDQSPQAATKLKDALKRAADVGQLGSVSNQQVEKRFTTPQPEQKQTATKEKGGKKKDKLTSDEVRELERMMNDIRTYWQTTGRDSTQGMIDLRKAILENNITEVVDLTGNVLRDQTQQFMSLYERRVHQPRPDRLTNDEIEQLSRYSKAIDAYVAQAPEDQRRTLRKDINTIIQTRDPNQLAKMMTPVGWNTEDAKNYLELVKSAVRIEEAESVALETFALTQTDFINLNPDYHLARKDIFFDDNLDLTPEGKKMMVNTMYEVIGKLFKNVSPTSLVGFDELNDRYSYSRVQRLIKESLIDMTRPSELMKQLAKQGKDQAYIQYSHKLIEEFNNENDMRTHYHEIKVKMFTTPIEAKNMKDYSARFPATMREQLLKGFDSALIDLGISEFERYVQKRIADNGNMLPTDLFASSFSDEGRLHAKDLIVLRENFTKRVRAIQDDPTMQKLAKNDSVIEQFMNVQQWQIDRAISLAAGFSMADSARMEEILATANKRSGNDFSGQLNIAQNFSMVHKWRLGRGRDAETATGWKTGELFSLIIDMDAGSKTFLQTLKNKWVPKDWYDKADPGVRRGLDEIFEDLDKTLTKKVKVGSTTEITFHEAMKTFNRLGMFSVAGWRIKGFNDWVKGEVGTIVSAKLKEDPEYAKLTGVAKEKYEDTVKQNTQVFDALKYDWLRRNVGVGACWLSDDGRAKGDAKELLFRQISIPGFTPDTKSNKTYLQQITEQLGATEVDRIYNNYTKRDSEDSERRILELHGKKITIEEYINERKRAYRGMNFQALLERSPYDFMLNMSQLEPEMAGVIKPEGSGVKKSSFTAYEFYFGTDTDGFSAADKKKRNQWRADLLRRWAVDEFEIKEATLDKMWREDDNVRQLEKIALTWHQIHTQYATKNEDGSVKSYNVNKSKDKMYEVLSTAVEKVKLKKEGKMTSADLGDTEEGQFFYNTFLGADGLAARLTEVNGKVEDKFGDFDAKLGIKGWDKQLTNMGAKRFFNTLAYRWYEVDQRDILPNTNEMNQVPVFTDMSKAGEETFTRLWGDVEKVSAVADKLVVLDNILLDVSTTGKMDKIYELHKSIQELEGTITIEGAQKWNYILATVVARFFQEDYKARFPWPLSMVMTPMSRSISLSSMHSGYNSFTMKEEDIRMYAHHLWREGWLGEKGKWSKEMLEQQLGAGFKKYFWMQAFPSLLTLGLFTGAMKMVSTAFSEEWNGKK